MPQQATVSAISRDARARNTDHLFVSNVRFWSMFAIIAVHSLLAWGIHADSPVGWEIQITLLQAAKFGTIGFYLISGFLLGERLDQYSAPEYLLRRLKKVGLPWAIWAVIYIFLPFVKLALLASVSTDTTSLVWRRASDVLIFSPYWFVPNFLLALTLLLQFQRHLDDLRFGAILLLISVFYGVNIYGKWVPSNHTSAVFGFVFYLWLGNWASRHGKKVSLFLDGVSFRTLLPGILYAGAISLGEAHLLNSLKADNIVNTLRISNQVFSVLVVLALVKLRGAAWPRFVNVRAHTFGLYLVHPVCMFVLVRLLDLVCRSVTTDPNGRVLETYTPFWIHPFGAMALWGAMLVLCYSSSLLIVRALAQGGLSWVIGQPQTLLDSSRQHASSSPQLELKTAA